MVIRYHQITLLIHFCWMMTCICLDERTLFNDINSRVLLIGFKYDDSNFYSAGHLESLLSTFIDDQSTYSIIQVEKNFVWGDRNQYGWCWRVMARRLMMFMMMMMMVIYIMMKCLSVCNEKSSLPPGSLL